MKHVTRIGNEKYVQSLVGQPKVKQSL